MKASLRVAVMTTLRGYSSRVLHGFMSYARPAKRWIVRFFPVADSSFQAMTRWRPDGILCQIHNDKQADFAAALRTPIVNYGFRIQRPGIVHVGQNDGNIGRMAARHFLDRGFQNFAFFGACNREFSTHRGDGFEAEAREAGFACQRYSEPEPPALEPADVWDWRQERVRTWLRALPKPVAVMACNDDWGWNAGEVCVDSEIPVPDDVALVGVDNDEILCAMAYPPLSSVDCAPERMGRVAGAELDRLMSKKKPRGWIHMFEPQTVVTRPSSDVLALPDADVAAAIRFIRERVAEGIGVEAVAGHVAISRRALERKFKAAMKRTMLDEIHRVRVERAKSLLSSTDQPVAAVALACGFQDRQRFGAVFKAAVGVTAIDFRRRTRME